MLTTAEKTILRQFVEEALHLNYVTDYAAETVNFEQYTLLLEDGTKVSGTKANEAIKEQLASLAENLRTMVANVEELLIFDGRSGTDAN